MGACLQTGSARYAQVRVDLYSVLAAIIAELDGTGRDARMAVDALVPVHIDNFSQGLLHAPSLFYAGLGTS